MCRFFVLCLALFVTACGGSGSDEKKNANSGGTETNATQSVAVETNSYSVSAGRSVYHPVPNGNAQELYVFADETTTFTAYGFDNVAPEEHTWELIDSSVKNAAQAIISSSKGAEYDFKGQSAGEYTLVGCSDKAKYNPASPEGYGYCINITVNVVHKEWVEARTDKETKVTLSVADFTGLPLKFIDIRQPSRGRLFVDKTRQQLTYDPLGGYDYLMTGNSIVEEVSVTLADNDHVVKKMLRLTVEGTATPPECNAANSVKIMPVSKSLEKEPVTVEPDQCVELDATNYSQPGQWWLLGETGLGSLLAYNGVEGIDNPILRFSYPRYDVLTLSWCSLNGNDCEPVVWAMKTAESKALEAPRLERWGSLRQDVSSTMTQRAKVTNRDDVSAVPGTFVFNWEIQDVTYDEYSGIMVGRLQTLSEEIDIDLPDMASDWEIGVRAEKIGNQRYYRESLTEKRTIYVRGDRKDAPQAIVSVSVNGTPYRGDEYVPGVMIVGGLHHGDLITFDASESVFRDSNPYNSSHFYYYDDGYMSGDIYQIRFVEHKVQEVTFCARNDYGWSAIDGSCIYFLLEESW